LLATGREDQARYLVRGIDRRDDVELSRSLSLPPDLQRNIG
jgi:hypothetical protein